MGKKLIKDSTLTRIADAIRAKGGMTGTMTPQEMPEKIAAIPTEEGGDIDTLIDRSVTEISSSSVTSIGKYAFAYCLKLTTVNLPVVTSIESSAFQSCSKLITVYLPLATSIKRSAFQYCSKLTTVDLPVATSIEANAFTYCSELKALLLRRNSICNLSNMNAFDSTPIRTGTGYIYVPSVMIEWYKEATNWANYSAQFRALENYTVDGTITGEIDPAKTGT